MKSIFVYVVFITCDAAHAGVTQVLPTIHLLSGSCLAPTHASHKALPGLLEAARMLVAQPRELNLLQLQL
jgi:hypothetical protein